MGLGAAFLFAKTQSMPKKGPWYTPLIVAACILGGYLVWVVINPIVTNDAEQQRQKLWKAFQDEVRSQFILPINDPHNAMIIRAFEEEYGVVVDFLDSGYKIIIPEK